MISYMCREKTKTPKHTKKAHLYTIVYIHTISFITPYDIIWCRVSYIVATNPPPPEDSDSNTKYTCKNISPPPPARPPSIHRKMIVPDARYTGGTAMASGGGETKPKGSNNPKIWLINSSIPQQEQNLQRFYTTDTHLLLFCRYDKDSKGLRCWLFYPHDDSHLFQILLCYHVIPYVLAVSYVTIFYIQ